MFHLATDEMRELVANCDRLKSMKHSSVPMTAFTEHGIIMLASVLKSRVAIEASIRITNTFVAMRKAIASIAPLLARIEATDRRQIADQAKIAAIGSTHASSIFTQKKPFLSAYCSTLNW